MTILRPTTFFKDIISCRSAIKKIFENKFVCRLLTEISRIKSYPTYSNLTNLEPLLINKLEEKIHFDAINNKKKLFTLGL